MRSYDESNDIACRLGPWECTWKLVQMVFDLSPRQLFLALDHNDRNDPRSIMAFSPDPFVHYDLFVSSKTVSSTIFSDGDDDRSRLFASR